ncbi:hypothetical protein [Streptomyces roseus]|uniref:Integral-membrane protein n=1 Tax=Streptomyces roseus TaxID=66430 RepID=A0A0J6XJD7_9ACTN|nr:hypothetical protein [Streptomyces roseus]KMO95299.1 hypothetical protein ACS04_23795 [Streptomyces roseus]
MTPDRCCRAFRAALFAAVCVLLASLGHLLMSGTAVPWWALAVAVAATAGVAWILAARERGLLAVTSATVAVQTVLHTGFSLAQAAVSPSTAQAPPPGAGGHAHHAAHAMGMADSGMTLPMQTPVRMPLPMATGHGIGSGSGSGSATPTGMLAAHLLAALLCGLWLAYGERGAFRVLRALAALLLVPLRGPLRPPAPAGLPRRGLRPDLRARPLRGLLLVHVLTSRGPPPGTAVI